MYNLIYFKFNKRFKPKQKLRKHLIDPLCVRETPPEIGPKRFISVL